MKDPISTLNRVQKEKLCPELSPLPSVSLKFRNRLNTYSRTKRTDSRNNSVQVVSDSVQKQLTEYLNPIKQYIPSPDRLFYPTQTHLKSVSHHQHHTLISLAQGPRRKPIDITTLPQKTQLEFIKLD